MENINWIKVGQKGIINLDLPVYSIGNGKNPSLAITCSVHGDETAGLFIVSKMLELLKNKSLKGTIYIIPAANPAAQFMNSRVSFLDHKDLNRVGGGRKDGSLTERTASALFEFLSARDAVINIHEFEMKTPVTGIFDNIGSLEIKKEIINLLKAFSPEIIWVLNFSKESDIQYHNTLDISLTHSGIPNFPIETTQLSLLSEQDIIKAAQGLINVASYLGITDKISENILNSHILIRHEVTSELSGIWEPNPELNLKEEIEKGKQIGTLKTLPDFQEHHIFSPYTGVLMQYRHRQLVATGAGLFSIGEKTELDIKEK